MINNICIKIITLNYYTSKQKKVKIKKSSKKRAIKKLGEDLYSLEVNLSIVGANRLNYQVRNVSGCTSVAMFTKRYIYCHKRQ